MIPKKIKMGWREYEVAELDEVYNDEGQELQGQINCTEETIELLKSLTEKQKSATLLHELVHHMFYVTGRPEAFQDEGIVSCVAEQIMQMICDNPHLVYQLLELKGDT